MILGGTLIIPARETWRLESVLSFVLQLSRGRLFDKSLMISVYILLRSLNKLSGRRIERLAHKLCAESQDFT